MNKQTGFTLIELIMVIVILGILAATALPKFVNMKKEAEVSALQGVQGGINSANAINRATELLNSASGVTVANCGDAAKLLEGGLPTGFAINATDAVSAITAGTTATNCRLEGTVDGATSAVFVTVTGVN